MSYDTDILTWSEQQAHLLRRMARGERVNGLDWENVAEEIESVGLSQLRAVQSQLRVALMHLLYLAVAWNRTAEEHWRTEVLAALGNAQDSYVPSMAQRIELDRVWLRALHQADEKLRRLGYTPPELPVPPGCPLTVDELLAEFPDIDALVAKIPT